MKLGREFLSFALVGVVGFAVDLGVLYLFAPVFGWYGARVVSFVAASTATWLLNRRFTFAERSRQGSLLREYLGYVLGMLGGATVNYAVYVLVLHTVDNDSWAPALGVALGSCSGLAVNFLAARYLVFGARKPR
ncbi:GtrA family protein [Burkholderiales bacterium 8X]|nr:GtrA family protein [Burkholderiales bacterium 8X]